MHGRKQQAILSSLLLTAFLCLAAAAAGQPPTSVATRDLPPVDPALTFTEIATELVVPTLDVAGGWLELTPLVGDREAAVILLGDRREEDGEERLHPGLPAEPAMLCSGGEPWAVTCDQVYLERGVTLTLGPVDPLEIDVRFASGVEVTGRYLLAAWPVAGARVAVVPAPLEAPRPYTLPLGPDRAGKMRRAVPTDDQGRFALPALAAGEYFLETLLPSGRVHRSDPFELPSETAVRTAAAIDDVTPVAWDLGDIDVAAGLTVEFQVRDPEGRPIAGAVVAGRQGAVPLTYVNYETETGADGNARMSGFTAEEPVHLRCQAEGYARFEHSYPLLPVVVACTLEPLGSVRGEVLGAAGLAIPGAVVSLRPPAASPPAGEPPAAESGSRPSPRPIVQPVDVAGGFAFAALEAGEYVLVAAAPGFEVEETAFTLAAGERRELGSIVLLPGRELKGRVVDADGRAPIAGAEIRSVEPAGAAWAVSGRDGAFTLASRSDRPLRLEVSAEGYAAVEIEVDLKPPRRPTRPPPLVVELEKAGWIQVLVFDGDSGRPCRGCRLVIAPAEELLTDGRGEALSGPLKEGWYRIRRPRVDHLGSTVIVEPESEVRQAKVEPGRVTTVRFGDSQEIVRVRFRPAADPGWRLSGRTPWRDETALPAADGSFRLRRRPGERLELYLQLWDPLAGAVTEVWQATLPADLEDGELVLARRIGSVTGRAIVDGRPIAGERVRLRSIEGAVLAAARTRPDGSFHLPFLPPGVYALAIGEPNVQILSLRDGQHLDLEPFELLAGGF